nr:hypothetical protein [Kibdelosporangium banguiense]
MATIVVACLIQPGDEHLAPGIAKDTMRKELIHCINNEVLSHVDGGRMTLVLVRPSTVVVFRVASVVGPAMPRVTDHPTAAITQHPAPEQVGAFRTRIFLDACAIARALAFAALRVDLIEHPLGNQRLVRRLRRPHPHLRRVGLVASASTPPCSAVVDLVTGVLRVLQDLGHTGLGPRAPGPQATRRFRRRMLLQIEIQPLCDRVGAEPLVVAPLRHQSDRFTLQPVWFQAGLGQPFLGFDRVRVPELLGLVAVRRFADVVALADVGAGAAPRLLQHVEDFVLGHRLVDPPLEDLLGAASGEQDRLVGGEHGDLSAFEFPLR